MNLLDLLGTPVATTPEEAYDAALTAVLLDHHQRSGGARDDAPAIARTINRLSAAIRQGDMHFAIDEIDALDLLRRSPIVGTPGASSRPLVLDGRDLYTCRHWQWRAEWRRTLTALNQPRAPRDARALGALLQQLFPLRDDGQPDAQRQAAHTAATRGLTVIAGGPGTGKTTTVVRLLAALLHDQSTLVVALAAPIGKAAARMSEAIRQQLATLPVPDSLRAAIPSHAQTLHRLLGARGDGAGFRHGADNRLTADLVIVDESSMLDVALAAQLASALRPDARLVLLGDPRQLGAVEAGAVFAELVREAEAPTSLWHDAVVTLHESRRYESGSALGALARAVLAGDAPESLALLTAQNAWQPTVPDAATLLAPHAGFVEQLRDTASRPALVLAAFDRHRVLAATHGGRGGTRLLNAAMVAALQALVPASRSRQGEWFHGRPVLVRQNDPRLDLFNGDVGLCLRDADGSLHVHFPAAAGTPRAFAPAQLSAVETAFAITVHQAQGSEFDSVDVVLDAQYAGNANRALIYTAITRARKAVRVFATELGFAAALRSS